MGPTQCGNRSRIISAGGPSEQPIHSLATYRHERASQSRSIVSTKLAVERGGSGRGRGGAAANIAVAAQAQHARLAQLRADATAASGPTALVGGLQLWVKTATGTLPVTADRGLDSTIAELRLKVRSYTGPVLELSLRWI